MSMELDLNDVAATSKKAQDELNRLREILVDAEFILRKASQIAGPMQDSFKRSSLDIKAVLSGDFSAS